MPHRVRIDWRRPGGRKPEGVIGVARPSRWGNPFAVAEWGRKTAVERFKGYAAERLASEPSWLDPLRGRDLACYYPLGQPCHADVLVEMANH